MNDNQFFNQLLYLKPYQEKLGCPCGDIFPVGGDGSVDFNDFGWYALCHGKSAPGEDCTEEMFLCSDLNGDGQVSMFDFGWFAVWYGGPVSTQRTPNCEPP